MFIGSETPLNNRSPASYSGCYVNWIHVIWRLYSRCLSL